MFRRITILLLASLIYLSPMTGIAEKIRTVTLSWDANSEPDLSHYVVYWGIESGEYTNNSGNIGLVTEYTVTLPEDENVYYFAVTAVDEAGLESDYSNEVNTKGPDAPTIRIKVAIDVDVTL